MRGEQEKRVAQYEQDHEIPVYYLFYNPREIPWQATIPFSHRAPNTRPLVGCRVVPSALLASRLDVKRDGTHPNYGDLRGLPQPFSSGSHLAGWRVEHFVAGEVLKCRQGHVATEHDRQSLGQVFFGRSTPIASAISITIEAPEDADLVLPLSTGD